VTSFVHYASKYENIEFARNDGILEVKFHTDGGPMLWGPLIHRDLPYAWNDIGSDPENAVVIVTHAGDAWCREFSKDRFMGNVSDPAEFGRTFYRIFWEAKRILQNQLEIDVPMIGVVNGPAFIHAEIPMLCDIVLASRQARFADKAHAIAGIAPGDGVQIVWPEIIGLNRARYFLLTGQELDADEAMRIGAVNEVMDSNDLMPRARELAAFLLQQPPLAVRYTRMALIQRLRAQVAAEWMPGAAIEGLSMAAKTFPVQEIEIG
jgi:enoyl-CoA hydratase/carnithine racemase